MADQPALSRLDLNLLVALDALLTERSVTRAAERLQLSQPALSAALARLRNHFGDPILARRGNSYDLTPLAVRLAEHTTAALEMSRRVFNSQADWSPAEAVREFSIYGSNYSFATTGRAVSRLIVDRAPEIKFRFMLHSTLIVEDIQERLRTADGTVMPHVYISGQPYLDLWKDSWVILAATDNPDTQHRVRMATIASSPWVFTYQSRTAFTSAGRQIQQRGIEPRIEVVFESFVTLPTFIAGTRRLGLIQAGLADLALAIGERRSSIPPSTLPRSRMPCGGTLRTRTTRSTSGCASSSPRRRRRFRKAEASRTAPRQAERRRGRQNAPSPRTAENGALMRLAIRRSLCDGDTATQGRADQDRHHQGGHPHEPDRRGQGSGCGSHAGDQDRREELTQEEGRGPQPRHTPALSELGRGDDPAQLGREHFGAERCDHGADGDAGEAGDEPDDEHAHRLKRESDRQEGRGIPARLSASSD